MSIDRRRMSGSYLPLREAMDRLFEGSFISPQMLSGQSGAPPANVHVTDDDVIIDMAVPGVNPDDINTFVTGDTVTISGESKRQRSEQKGQAYIEEIMEGNFQRSFVLPFPVDADRASATVNNGILKLTLPKSESAKPRKIQVSQQRATIEQPSQAQTQSGNIQEERVRSSSTG